MRNRHLINAGITLYPNSRASRTRLRFAALSVILLAGLVGAPSSGAWAAEKGSASGAGKFLGYAVPASPTGAGVPPPPASAAVGVLGESLAADAIKPSVPIYAAPGGGKVLRSLANPTREGVKLIFGALEQNGEWLKVILPVRPNGSTGWVRTSDVKVRTVASHIVVDLSDFRLRLFKGQELQMEVPVGVGKANSPTPLGRFYVDISVPLQPTTGAYGAYMLSVAGFSEVLTNFGGGVGQIAIHGTVNLPSVGVNSSNGCLRLTNENILKLKDLAPAGTPVLIQA